MNYFTLVKLKKLTAEVCISDLFERFVWHNIQEKVVDFVQDIISSGVRGDVGAESAEIQEITEQSWAIFMKLARKSALLRGGLAMIAGGTNRLQW